MSHKSFLLSFLFEHIIIIFFLLFMLNRYIKKGLFIVDVGDEKVDWKMIKMIQQHEKILTVIFNGLIFALMFLAVSEVLIPFFKDLPYIYREEYLYVEGTVIKSPNIESTNKLELYNVTIKEAKTEEEIRVSLYGKNGIWTGDQIKAEYLPNSELGILLEKKGEKRK